MMKTRKYSFIPVLVLCFLVFTPLISHADFLQETLWAAITGIFGTILALCAWLFDVAINNYVIGFADEYTTSGIGIAIDQGWSLVRDIMNLVFIFGLLYIGFKIILNSDDSSTRKVLVNLIIAALLVNFSLFITKFVVDTSNAFASQIAINGFFGTLKQVPNAPQGVERYQVDMSEDLMARLGLSSIFDYENDANTALKNEWGYIFGTAILMIVASFVFAAGGILLIIRFVTLNFYILFSPFMFIGWAFPPLERYTKQYWKGFLGKAFFAPVYLLFIYFSVSIISALRDNRGLSDFASDSLGNALQNPSGSQNFDRLDSASAFPYFVLAICSLLISLFAAQKLGADGADQAIRMGKNGMNSVRNRTKKMAVGTGRFAARNTGGVALRGAQSVSSDMHRKYQKLDARMANNKYGRFARGAVNAATLGATKDKNIQAGFSGISKARVANSETYAEVQKREAEEIKRQNRIAKETDRENKLKDAYFGYEKDKKILDNASVGDQIKVKGQLWDITSQQDIEDLQSEIQTERDREIGAVINKMSDDEIKAQLDDQQFMGKLGGKFTAGNIFKDPTVAKHLKDSQIKALADSGRLRNDDIKAVNEAWGRGNIDEVLEVQEKANATTEQLENSIKKLGENIKAMSKDRLSSLNLETLQEEGVAVHLQQKDLDNLKDSGKFNTDQLKSIEEARNGALEKIAKNGTYVDENNIPAASDTGFKQKQRENMFKVSAKEGGNYPVAVFKVPDTYDHASPQMLEERLKNGDVTKQDLRDMKSAFTSSSAATNQAWRKWETGNSTHAAQFFN